jgi:hypothetical protein
VARVLALAVVLARAVDRASVSCRRIGRGVDSARLPVVARWPELWVVQFCQV